MFCRECGAEVSPSAKFCPRCGHNLEGDLSSRSEAGGSSRLSPFWFKTLLAFLGLIAAGALFYAVFSVDLTDTVSEQLKALRQGDITEAYYHFTSKKFQEATSLENFRDFLQHFPIFSKNKSVRFVDRNVGDDVGRLEARLLAPDGKEFPVEYQLIKEGDEWKILSIKIEEPANEQPPAAPDVKEAMLMPIDTQLKAIQAGDLKKSYEGLVSVDFSKATPWNDFESFIKSHPIFSQFRSIQYEQATREGDKGRVTAILESPQGRAKLSYHLIQEGGKWKIWGLHLDDSELKREVSQSSETSAPSDFNEKPIYDAIRQQFELIKNKDLLNAYHKYASQAFQKATSLKEFEAFVKGQPGFANNRSLELKQLKFDNNMANVLGELTSEDGKVYSVSFDLIYEDDAWKIVYIQMLDSAEKETKKENSENNELAFSSFILGKAVDGKGVIIDPATAFKTNAEAIYLNVPVINGVEGVPVEVLFKHIDSHSNLPSLATKIPNDGKAILSFVFSSPKEGWPKGDYEITARTPTGKQGSVKFSVN